MPLLVYGLLLGPGFDVLDPDALFGALLFPMVSLSVAIILFEGALTLDLREIRGHGTVVRNLVSLGMVVTWVIIALATHWLIDLSWSLACLFAALVVVAGPTVIVPLLRAARPSAKLANILRWEGIIIDPVGALLAVLIYEVIIANQEVALLHATYAFVMTLVIGFGLGYIAARLTERSMLGRWMPHYLRHPAILCFMLGIYALSNQLQHESGLLTVTVVGMALANRYHLDLESVHEFKETLSVLLISALFILLAARLDISQLKALGWPVLALVAIIMFVVRPVSVWLSSIGSDLNWCEKVFLSWISPRGIVAAAVSGLFALKLEQQGWQEAGVLVPMVFMVIIATVSLTARLFIRKWGLQEASNDGFLVFGANKAARMIATALHKNDIPVRLADTNWEHIKLARMESLPTYYGNPASEHACMHLVLEGLGRVLVLSPYRQMNALVELHFQNWFGKSKVYALAMSEVSAREKKSLSREKGTSSAQIADGLSYAKVLGKISRGASIKATTLPDEFSFADYQKQYEDRATMLFAISPRGKCTVWNDSLSEQLEEDWKLLSLVVEDE